MKRPSSRRGQSPHPASGPRAQTRGKESGQPKRYEPIVRGWSPLWSCASLAVATILCLAPFADRALHIDDPLFVWAAKQIGHHPLDPYGFRVVWYLTEMPMSEVTKNPPLASYYSALAGSLAGWSERTLHLAFILPALCVVLGTYYLARRFCGVPLLAAAATLLTPGFMVSACSVMSDTMMLALWTLAAILWSEGLDPLRPSMLAGSGLLIALSALTKYFGASLILLLLLYSVARKRGLGIWALYLLIPVLILAAYQAWTGALYGRGLLLDAAQYANASKGTSTLAKGLVTVGFVGGCMLPGLSFAPLLWSRGHVLVGMILSGVAAMAIGMGWVASGAPIPAGHERLVSVQLGLFLAGGASVLGLGVVELARRRSADSLFLVLWVLGTFLFAGFFNWTVNARSVLPLIPAAAILLARRLEAVSSGSSRSWALRLALPLLVSGALSVWVAQSDTALANAQRTAAERVMKRARHQAGDVWFQGHWGFQYYMQSLGARPMASRTELHAGDHIVVPENNTNTFPIDPGILATRETVEVRTNRWLTTMHGGLGAGYYAYIWGPLPFAFGRVPPERFQLLRLAPITGRGG